MSEAIMPEVNVFDPHSGSDIPEVRHQWRINRRAAYRLAYKEREGKAHPADKDKEVKAQTKYVSDNIEPPVGMTWQDFGVLWDLHPDHPNTPVLRKQSVAAEWQAAAQELAEPLTVPSE